MCSDMLGCLKLTLGTKYLEVCRYLQQQIQAMQEKPSTFFVGWFGYTMDPPFVVSSSSFFFGPGTIPVVTTKQQLLKPQEIQVVAGLDSVDLGRKRNHLEVAWVWKEELPVISIGFTNWDDQNPFSTIFWNVVNCSSSFLIDASRPSSLRGGGGSNMNETSRFGGNVKDMKPHWLAASAEDLLLFAGGSLCKELSA